jgi:hypothetical protein
MRRSLCIEDFFVLDGRPWRGGFREWDRFESGDHSAGRRASVVVQRLVSEDSTDETRDAARPLAQGLPEISDLSADRDF